MRYDPLRHHRRSIRLRGHDYAAEGAYFVTFCTHERECILGEIKKGAMVLSNVGLIALECWLEVPTHFPNATLDKFVIMPDHMHGILILKDCALVGVQSIEPRRKLNQYQKIIPGSLSSIIRSYKAAVTRLCRRQGIPQFQWQRNYYEHIVRDGHDLDRIQKYIADNVSKWSENREKPENDPRNSIEMPSTLKKRIQ
jgi:REP element-mobilizing transposase RayT